MVKAMRAGVIGPYVARGSKPDLVTRERSKAIEEIPRRPRELTYLCVHDLAVVDTRAYPLLSG
jgi:hypothetical protein